MHQLPVNPDEVGMPIRHFQVVHWQRPLPGSHIRNGRRAFVIIIPALEQQLAAFLEQDRVAPAVGGLERVAFGGGQGLPVVQFQADKGLGFVAGVNIRDFFVTEPPIHFAGFPLVFPFGERQHLVTKLDVANWPKRGFPEFCILCFRLAGFDVNLGVGGEAVDGAGHGIPGSFKPFEALPGQPTQTHPGGATDGAVLGRVAPVVAFAGGRVDDRRGDAAFRHAQGKRDAPRAFAGRVADVGRVGFAVAVLVVAARQAYRVLGEVAPGGWVVVLTGVACVEWNCDLAYCAKWSSPSHATQ